MTKLAVAVSRSVVSGFATPWTAALQAPPSMGFSRQEHWSGVPSPSPNLSCTKSQTAGTDGRRQKLSPEVGDGVPGHSRHLHPATARCSSARGTVTHSGAESTF